MVNDRILGILTRSLDESRLYLNSEVKDSP